MKHNETIIQRFRNLKDFKILESCQEFIMKHNETVIQTLCTSYITINFNFNQKISLFIYM